MGKTWPAKEDPAGKRISGGDGVDPVFLCLVAALLALGLILLWSASFAQSLFDTGQESSGSYVKKQALSALLGLAAMALLSRVPTALWERAAWPVYGLSVALLLLVLAAGETVNGAKRWLSIGILRFQPSELAKFSLVLVFARLTHRFGPDTRKFSCGVLTFGAALMGLLVPLALEKHLSAIMLMGMVAVGMMFIAGARVRWLLAGGAAAAVFAAVYIRFMGYAGDRVTAWLHPEADPGDTGYQILQSLYAIGSGGLFGLGFGKSRQKYLYLPFQYNDYIFAVVCEELGLVGALGILALFAALILRGYRIALRASGRFATALGAGLVTLTALQILLNLCVVTNMLPSTGISLPFFSYGGTALAMNLGQMGILLGISRSRNQPKLQEEFQ